MNAKKRPVTENQPKACRAEFTLVTPRGDGSFLVRPGNPRVASMLTVKQAAAVLKVTERHIADAIEVGELQAINVGTEIRHHWRIAVAALDAFLKRKRSLPAL